MKFSLLLLAIFTSHIVYSQSKKLDAYEVAYIDKIKTLFGQNNIEQISSIINFPLHREYPIPSIRNKKELKLRFNEVFDKTLIDKIATSKTEQWSEVGWRGIMLDNGLVWINDNEGKIIAVNYQSNIEKTLRKNLIEKEKENLHISLKKFASPVYKIKTGHFLIRIDKLSDLQYRYASWKIDKKESTLPDIILSKGVIEFQGSGGNHIITFRNGIYKYKVYRNIIGEDNSPDITLEVEKDGKIILTERGALIE